MVSFKEYLREAVALGNYVCVNVDPSSVFSLPITPSTGVEVKLEDKHVTLMYSKNSMVDPKVVQNWLNTQCVDVIVAEGAYFAAFDSVPKEGERDENLATLVLKLESSVLHSIHEKLKAMGMQHSYAEFSPHVSLYYKVDRDECHRLVEELNNRKVKIASVVLNGYKSQPIDEDWVNKLKT